MKRGIGSFCFALVTCITLAYSGVAQQFTRAEIGVNTSFLHPNRFLPLTDTGFGGRFTYNLTPSLAFDSEFDSYLTNLNQRGVALATEQDGGRASALFLGVKAGIRKNEYGIFLKIRPGFMTFGDVLTSAANFGSLATTRKTHAALDLGAAAEYYPSARTILRLDVGQLLVRYGDSTPVTFPDGISIRNIGRIAGSLHVEAGIGYRLRGLFHETESSPSPQRFAAGIQYSLLTSERGFFEVVRDESGAGGWFTWNFSKYFALDSSATYFPRLIHIADIQQGGRMFQALAGIRGGIRREHFGVFAKFRPGIQLYTATEGNAVTFRSSPFTDLAFDSGGIIEVYTSPRTLLRFEAGNTSVYYRPRNVIDTGGSFHVAGFTNNTIQLTTGFGFRF
ncbi:MAG: hypothetical protein ACRD4I_02110 [Candidatus Angelobacter sp.]